MSVVNLELPKPVTVTMHVEQHNERVCRLVCDCGEEWEVPYTDGYRSAVEHIGVEHKGHGGVAGKIVS